MAGSRDETSPALPPSAPGHRAELSRLLGELAAGRGDALDGIYRLAADELFGLALWRTGSPDDAADVVQEVFLRLARNVSRLGSVREPLAYLRLAAHRVAIDLHRRRRRRPETPLETCAYLVAPASAPERRLDAERTSRLLGELPPAQREAIYLRLIAGCSFAEIGRATGVPTFTAASRYRSGMRRLRRLAGVEA